MEDRLSSPAEDLEHLLAAKGRGRWIGQKILNCMGSEGVGEPGRRLALERVGVVKIAALRKRSGKGQSTVRKKKVKNLIGVKMSQRRNR